MKDLKAFFDLKRLEAIVCVSVLKSRVKYLLPVCGVPEFIVFGLIFVRSLIIKLTS